MAWHGSYGMQTIALRFANVYGRYSTHKSSVVARFIKDALREQQITIYGDGGQTRDFIDARDIAQGIRLALENTTIGGEVIQLGTGIETPILELANMLKSIVPYELNIQFDPPRVADIYRNYSDISKARQLLNFSPQIALKDGFNDTYQWLTQQE
jgi:UDP-glucose 4-epimerase